MAAFETIIEQDPDGTWKWGISVFSYDDPDWEAFYFDDCYETEDDANDAACDKLEELGLI